MLLLPRQNLSKSFHLVTKRLAVHSWDSDVKYRNQLNTPSLKIANSIMIYCFHCDTSLVMNLCQCLMFVTSFHTTVVTNYYLCSSIIWSTVCLNTQSYHSFLYETCSEQVGFFPHRWYIFFSSDNVAWIVLILTVTVQETPTFFHVFVSPLKLCARMIYSDHFEIPCTLNFPASISDKILTSSSFLSCFFHVYVCINGILSKYVNK